MPSIRGIDDCRLRRKLYAISWFSRIFAGIDASRCRLSFCGVLLASPYLQMRHCAQKKNLPTVPEYAFSKWIKRHIPVRDKQYAGITGERLILAPRPRGSTLRRDGRTTSPLRSTQRFQGHAPDAALDDRDEPVRHRPRQVIHSSHHAMKPVRSPSARGEGASTGLAHTPSDTPRQRDVDPS